MDRVEQFKRWYYANEIMNQSGWMDLRYKLRRGADYPPVVRELIEFTNSDASEKCHTFVKNILKKEVRRLREYFERRGG